MSFPIQNNHGPEQPIATFSIAGIDTETGDVGAATASRYIAVGSLVLHVAAGVGVILTQSVANPLFGPRGLSALASGRAPHEVIDLLLADDPDQSLRQLAVLSALNGLNAAYSGPDCVEAVGSAGAPGVVCIGNTLNSSAVTYAMLETFNATQGTLWERLLSALIAGDESGGDSRGKMAAAIRVHRQRAGYRGQGEVLMDLRVDEHPEPITELSRIVALFVTDYMELSAGYMNRTH